MSKRVLTACEQSIPRPDERKTPLAPTPSTLRALRSDTDAMTTDLLDAPWNTYRPTALQRMLITLTQNTILQRGRLRHLMTKWITALGRPLDISFRGCNYRIEGRNNLIETGMLTRPSYNGVEIDFLGQAVRDGGVMLDIGSNVGLYSLPLARMAGPEGRMLSIDANLDMVRHLDFNAQASGLSNVTAIHCAVGDAAGRVDLQILKDDVAIVNVVENAGGAIEMLPLLTLVTQAGLARVDAIKIDIEGHEDKALVPYLQQASDDLLPSHVVIEYSEAQGDYPGCAAEFARLGYRLVARTRNNSLYQRG
jgi:FkbM family methyltransferase